MILVIDIRKLRDGDLAFEESCSKLKAPMERSDSGKMVLRERVDRSGLQGRVSGKEKVTMWCLSNICAPYKPYAGRVFAISR